MVYDQTPKYMRWAKVPVVKAKVGPKVMTLMADERAFQMLPVKTEAKVVVSGIYITEVKRRPRRNSRSAAEEKGLLCKIQKRKESRQIITGFQGHNTKRDIRILKMRTPISVF